jgi:acetyl/propionyl-CoA carboxylase alpha subunit
MGVMNSRLRGAVLPHSIFHLLEDGSGPGTFEMIAHGKTREQAIDRLQDALGRGRLHIPGIMHNTGHLQSVLRHQGFRCADLHTGFLGAAPAELLSSMQMVG